MKRLNIERGSDNMAKLEGVKVLDAVNGEVPVEARVDRP